MNTVVGIGIPGITPPKHLNSLPGTIGRRLELIHAAIERPAVNMMSVAIIGWILKIATSAPLNAPHSIPTRHATRKATMIGAFSVSGDGFDPQRIRSIAEPAIAIVAPTEISCPPEAAVTSVMPIARIASSEP